MIRKFFFILILFLLVGQQAMAIDEPKYNLEKKEGNIEIRHYSDSVVAEVKVQGTREEAVSIAFRILFNFISGNNLVQKEIKMTAPVSQQKSSEKIPMTSPVTQHKNDTNNWTVAFYMPSDMTYEKTPKPKDSRIQIKKITGDKVAVIKFSGFHSDSNFSNHEKKLKQYLDERGYKYKSVPTLAYYDPPFTPWFLRRNEVMYTLVSGSTIH